VFKKLILTFLNYLWPDWFCFAVLDALYTFVSSSVADEANKPDAPLAVLSMNNNRTYYSPQQINSGGVGLNR
jgi:hypothetical protein